MSDKVRFAVIGTSFGTVVHIPALQSSEGMEVVAVCSAREERAAEAAERFEIPRWTADYHDVLAMDDVDAVTIAAPVYLHYPMTMAAIEAGKHVLCEKPMALSVEEGLRMAEAAEARGIVNTICFEFRWTPARAYAAQLISEGYLGRMRHINMALYLPGRGGSLASPYRTWAAERAMGGGMLGALGSHYIDALRFWMGDLATVTGKVFTHVPEREDPETGETVLTDADDAFALLATARSGAWASISQSMAAPFGSGTVIELYGDEGSLRMYYPSFNPPPNGRLFGAHKGDDGIHELRIPDRYRPFEDARDDRMMPFRMMVEAFARGVREGQQVAPTFRDGVKVQEVMDGVLRSSETGETVPLTVE